MQLGLRGRLVLGATLQVTAFVAVAVFVLAVLTDEYASEQVEQQIEETRASFDMQMELRLRAWRRETVGLARSPMLLATAAIPEVDEATFADVLEELAAPVIAVLDVNGRVAASRGAWPAGTDASVFAGFAESMEASVSDHMWPIASGCAIVAVAPLVQGGELLGALVRGEPVDASLADRIGALSGREVVLVDDGRHLAERWNGDARHSVDLSSLMALRHADVPEQGLTITIFVDSEPRAGIALPLHEDGAIAFLSHELGAIFALRDRARSWLLIAGCLLALVGVVFAVRTAARLSRPLRELTDASDHMGQGDLATRVETRGMDRELGQLARSFNAMAQTMQTLVADVTEKAARAEAANRAKDGFLTSVSHELRTPLTGIQSTAELLQTFGDEVSGEERADFLTTIQREAERLGQRISDALDFANFAGGKASWTVGRVDLRACGEEACQRLRGLLDLKPVDIAVLSEVEKPVLQGDRERITQAIYHLLHNAWTWSPAESEIEITIKSVAHGFVIDVSDRGPGIPAAERSRVFDSFAQGGDVLVDKPAGIGLGLPIVAEVAAMHGGAVEYSDRKDGGACLHLLLRVEDRPIDRLEVAAGSVSEQS